jgi:hypothetical protein
MSDASCWNASRRVSYIDKRGAQVSDLSLSPGRFVGISGRDPTVSKVHLVHMLASFAFSLWINSRQIPVDSCRTIVNFPVVLNFNRLFLKLNRFICTNDRGEMAVSYRWTGWVWDVTDWSSRLQEKKLITLEEFIEYTPGQFNQGNPKVVNM